MRNLYPLTKIQIQEFAYPKGPVRTGSSCTLRPNEAIGGKIDRVLPRRLGRSALQDGIRPQKRRKPLRFLRIWFFSCFLSGPETGYVDNRPGVAFPLNTTALENPSWVFRPPYCAILHKSEEMSSFLLLGFQWHVVWKKNDENRSKKESRSDLAPPVQGIFFGLTRSGQAPITEMGPRKPNKSHWEGGALTYRSSYIILETVWIIERFY